MFGSELINLGLAPGQGMFVCDLERPGEWEGSQETSHGQLHERLDQDSDWPGRNLAIWPGMKKIDWKK